MNRGCRKMCQNKLFECSILFGLVACIKTVSGEMSLNLASKSIRNHFCFKLYVSRKQRRNVSLRNKSQDISDDVMIKFFRLAQVKEYSAFIL